MWKTRRYKLLVGVFVAGVVLGPVMARWALGARRARERARRMALLRSDDPQQRKRAAWSLVDDPDPALIAFIRRQLMGGEQVADVRESYAWTLGNLQDPRNFATLARVLEAEHDGYVRAAVWLAAARVDGARFERLAQRRGLARLWDRIGIAEGRLLLGNVTDVGLLLDVAATGTAQQRYVAGRALYKWLRPLLETAGRWPLSGGVDGAGAWPRAFVGVVARRCESLDLQAIANDNLRFAERIGRLHRDEARITNARDDLAGLLFAR